MIDSETNRTGISGLAELSREVEELENGRAELLRRLDKARASLLQAGQRTSAIRASIDLLCDHVEDIVSIVASLHALEEEVRQAGSDLAETGAQSSSLLFETSGLDDSIEEAEDELNRLTALITEGRARPTRGH